MLTRCATKKQNDMEFRERDIQHLQRILDIYVNT